MKLFPELKKVGQINLPLFKFVADLMDGCSFQV